MLKSAIIMSNSCKCYKSPLPSPFSGHIQDISGKIAVFAPHYHSLFSLDHQNRSGMYAAIQRPGDTGCRWCEPNDQSGKRNEQNSRVRGAVGGCKHICSVLTFEGLLWVNGGCAIEPSILECQKAVSTLFWTYIEQLLCLKATLCADTIATLYLCVCVLRAHGSRGSHLPVCFHTPPSLFPRCVLHLFPPPREIPETSPRVDAARAAESAQTDASEQQQQRRPAHYSIPPNPLNFGPLRLCEQSSPTAKNWWKLIVSALGKHQK